MPKFVNGEIPHSLQHHPPEYTIIINILEIDMIDHVTAPKAITVARFNLELIKEV